MEDRDDGIKKKNRLYRVQLYKARAEVKSEAVGTAGQQEHMDGGKVARQGERLSCCLLCGLMPLLPSASELLVQYLYPVFNRKRSAAGQVRETADVGCGKAYRVTGFERGNFVLQQLLR